ncbi:MAG TPA: ribonuclease Z [Solirubrobacteraceae bacterium]|jgi:ribonuclease Z
MELAIFFAGTGGSAPTARRGLPSLLVRRGGDRIMFDCGEGTQRQLVSSIGLSDLDDIFLTHFHADHWLGLPGMLKTFDLRGREKPLTIYGPPGVQTLLALVLRMAGRVGFDLGVVELGARDVVARDGYRIAPVEVSHRGAAFGYVLFEDDRPGVFDPAAAVRLGLEPGPEFGRVQRGETIRGVSPDQVMGETRPGRKLVLSGDTQPCDSLRIAAHRAELLVHEATFSDEERERAAETGHSTATQAAALAREAEVDLLALNHVSMRHPVAVLRDEARALFARTVIPRDFDSIEIPLAERGEPTLVRWEPDAATPRPQPTPARAPS